MAKPHLSGISTVDLRRELDRRAAQVDQMDLRRRELRDELSRIESEIEALGGTGLAIASPAKAKRFRSRKSPRRGTASNAARTRAENSMTLTQALLQALKGKTMGVGEIAEAVQKAGYKTNAKSFRTIVNLTLLKRKDLFKKKGRGQYTAK